MSALSNIEVPDMGDLKDVSIIAVLVHAGETVSAGQALLTVETDKATMDIPSPQAGVIRELSTVVGGKINSGDRIALLEVADAADAPLPAAPHARQMGAEEPDPQPVPPAQQVVPDSASSARATLPAQQPAARHDRLPYASPSIRRMARELGVPLDEVVGSGARGRIRREDLQRFVKEALSGPTRSASSSAGVEAWSANLPPWPQVDFARFGPVTRRELSRIRRISGASLHRNWVRIPHVTNHEDADITELEAFRRRLNAENEGSGVKVTLLSLVMKACVAALKVVPEFNASLDGEHIVLKHYFHIGFAVDTPNGLMVPVIRDIDQKGVLELASETAVLAARAREGKLAPPDLAGGCFSISSLGGIGGTYFTPIINAPEVAILGVGRSITRVMWNGKEPEPRLILPLSLSWDHRAVDGAAAVRFNACLAQVLADLRRAML